VGIGTFFYKNEYHCADMHIFCFQITVSYDYEETLRPVINMFKRQYGPPKRWYPTTNLHGVTTQKTEDGGTMDLRNVGILPQHYRRHCLESSPPSEPRISQLIVVKTKALDVLQYGACLYVDNRLQAENLYSVASV
jgi:hypothetical protein